MRVKKLGKGFKNDVSSFMFKKINENIKMEIQPNLGKDWLDWLCYLAGIF